MICCMLKLSCFEGWVIYIDEDVKKYTGQLLNWLILLYCQQTHTKINILLIPYMAVPLQLTLTTIIQ